MSLSHSHPRKIGPAVNCKFCFRLDTRRPSSPPPQLSACFLQENVEKKFSSFIGAFVGGLSIKKGSLLFPVDFLGEIPSIKKKKVCTTDPNRSSVPYMSYRFFSTPLDHLQTLHRSPLRHLDSSLFSLYFLSSLLLIPLQIPPGHHFGLSNRPCYYPLSDTVRASHAHFSPFFYELQKRSALFPVDSREFVSGTFRCVPWRYDQSIPAFFLRTFSRPTADTFYPNLPSPASTQSPSSSSRKSVGGYLLKVYTCNSKNWLRIHQKPDVANLKESFRVLPVLETLSRIFFTTNARKCFSRIPETNCGDPRNPLQGLH